MIAEILDSASFASVRDYHYNKIERGVATAVNHNYDRDTALRLLHEPTLIRNAYRKPYKNEPLFHVVISPSKEDMTILSETQVLELAHEYLEKMGFTNHEFQIYKHDDTEHPHFHFVCNRIDLNTMNKVEQSFEKLRSVEIMEQLSRKYGLRTAKEQGLEQAIENKEKAGAKKALEGLVKEVIQQSTSYEEFLLNLSFKDVILTESSKYKRRNNKAYTYHFRYKGRMKHMSCSTIKPSLKSIRKSFEKLSTKEKIKRKTTFVLNTYKEEIVNPAMFEKLMNRMGVKVEYSKHVNGSIFGCSFVDLATFEIIKASDIKLGWNTLKSHINEINDDSVCHMDANQQYATWINYKKDDNSKLCDWTDKEKKAAILSDHGRPSSLDYQKASFYQKQQYVYATVMKTKSLYDIPCVHINIVSKNGMAIDIDYEGVKLSDLFGNNPIEFFNNLIANTPKEAEKIHYKDKRTGHTIISGFSRHSDNETLEEQQRRIRKELGL